MKSFFNILDLNIELYKILGLSQAIPDQERLGNKSHRSLIKHQEAYGSVQSLIDEHVNEVVRDRFITYSENANYFFKTLNADLWNTPKTESECIEIYWQYFLAPMAATLLDACREGEHQGSTVYYLWKLIQTWDLSMEAKDLKVWIKRSIKKEGGLMKAWVQQSIEIKGALKTPEFTKKVNDIRDSIHSPETINININELSQDLTKQGVPDYIEQQATSQMRGIYQATMIIHRICKNGSDVRLNQIKQHINQLINYGEAPNIYQIDKLLVRHQRLKSNLLSDSQDSWKQRSITAEFNILLDNVLQREVPELSKKITSSKTDMVWPKQEVLSKVLFGNQDYAAQTELDSIIQQYYKMYYLAGNGEHKEAFELCSKILNDSKDIHLGEIKSSLLIHKMVLGYEVGGMNKHNQFNGVLTDIALTLPDESQLNPELMGLFDSNERMRSTAYNLYNIGHPKAKISPLKKLELLCGRALEIVNNNPNEEAKELLPELRKALGNEVTAESQLLPFTDKLTPKMALDDLFMIAGYYRHSPTLTFLEFKNNEKCEELVSYFFRLPSIQTSGIVA
jgi:hypothetical protein